MTTVLLITLEDINSRVIGNHFEVVTKEGLVLNFTKEAVEELKHDIKFYETELENQRLKAIEDLTEENNRHKYGE